MLERLEETIVAVSSAPGRSAVGIVRLSGPRAYPILRDIGTLPDTPDASSRRVRGQVNVVGASFPAVFYLFHKPRSYTRQDLIEIHTVGAPVVLEMVRWRCVELGAVAAQPGEFTARAFFNGALDLVAAEGVARLIRAQSDTQLAAARRMMDGVLSRRIVALRDELAELLGLVEAGIDFAEEPIEFITPVELERRLSLVAGQCVVLVPQAAGGEVLEPLPRILLLGPPNAGKSSLMNRLAGSNRAISAPVAGTTRDVLSAPVRLGRLEAMLLDAAGIDDSTDEIISKARGMALAAAGSVDLLCVVLDAHALSQEHAATNEGFFQFKTQISGRSTEIRPGVVVLNKSDLLSAAGVAAVLARLRGQFDVPIVTISALRGDGIEELRRVMERVLGAHHATVGGESMVLSERQRTAVAGALEAIHRGAQLARHTDHTSQCADLLAFELREALDLLGSVTGAVTTEDLLGQIFANFCIGK